ncbi:MAG: hypothetical protein ACYTG2_15945 [Planctomycetota bacterium]|jgi:hypothetical protein
MSTTEDHLGERRFHECPVCIDAEAVRTDGHAPALALWLSVAFAAAGFGLLLMLR